MAETQREKVSLILEMSKGVSAADLKKMEAKFKWIHVAKPYGQFYVGNNSSEWAGQVLFIYYFFNYQSI